MKKIMPIFLSIVILLTGTDIYAAGIAAAGRQAKLKEIIQLSVQVRLNSTKISEQKQEIRNAHQLAKARLKIISNDKDKLTDQQINSLTETLKAIKQDRARTAEWIKIHNAAIARLRTARRNNDPEKIRISLIELIKVQKRGLVESNKLLEDLNTIVDY